MAIPPIAKDLGFLEKLVKYSQTSISRTSLTLMFLCPNKLKKKHLPRMFHIWNAEETFVFLFPKLTISWNMYKWD